MSPPNEESCFGFARECVCAAKNPSAHHSSKNALRPADRRSSVRPANPLYLPTYSPTRTQQEGSVRTDDAIKMEIIY